VIDLPDAGRDVAVVLEQLRQRHGIRPVLAELRDQLVNANRIGSESRQQRCAAWIAQRKLVVGAVEPYAPLRQPIDVRRLDDRVTIRAQVVVEIVGHDQQHIGPARCG
jgi:hypothetical protein